MLIINKNTTNTIAPTLYEKTTLSPVYYLLEFENKQTKEKSYCIPTELSTELQRYNKFIITDTSSPVPLNGEVNLKEGDYTYTFYEQSSSTNLDPTGLTSVEEMECHVKDSTSFANTEYVGASSDNTVYEG